MKKDYRFYSDSISGVLTPCALLDLEMFHDNINAIANNTNGKNIRIASKSLRSREAMKLVLDSNDCYKGIMTYSGSETIFLANQGFDDLLIGYPLTDKQTIEQICILIKSGKTICFMVDCPEHIALIQNEAKKVGCTAPVCIDVDVSDTYPFLYFGVKRSSIKTMNDFNHLLEEIKNTTAIKLDGIMCYEAQVAGIGDTVFGKGIKSRAVQFLKKKAIKNVAAKRAAVVDAALTMGFDLRFVNGGGTGSLEFTKKENVVTEITVGSGFFNGHLFDNYAHFKMQPALFFALSIVRKPAKNTYTCYSGGYIASGGIGKEKLPVVYLPEAGMLDENEGAGEVQTPVIFPNKAEKLQIGDPIFFRHAKSGEVCERFNEIITLAQGGVIGSLTTYRGEGKNFG
jgi:D-serine deaminase-like pyridoxal phosphate-dependent protein